MRRQRWMLLILMLLAVGPISCELTQPPMAIPASATPPAVVETVTLPLSKPEAPSIEPPEEIEVTAGGTTPVRASAAGADGYRWELQGVGEISALEGEIILYTAPQQVPEEGGMALLTVTAYNAAGESPSTTLIVTVPGSVPSEPLSVGLGELGGIPAGWMSGGGNPAEYISLDESPDDCYTGADCTRFTYRTGGDWGGIYWWPLSCGDSGTGESWNRVQNGTCGVNVLDWGFSAMNRLTFWARGEQGGEMVEFKIGGADVPPMPGRSLGRVKLGTEWQQYAIDLQGADMTNAVGLFLWVATDADNPEGAVFDLDDIQFEGMR